MFGKLAEIVADFIVEFLFGALYRVLYVYRLPEPFKTVAAIGIIVIYGLIELFLAINAINYGKDGNTYMMFLCWTGFIVFALLMVCGFLHQRKQHQD